MSFVFAAANENWRRKNVSIDNIRKLNAIMNGTTSARKERGERFSQRCSVKSRVNHRGGNERNEILILYRGAHSLVALMTQHGKVCRRKSKVRPVL